jgi:hypothetical protein
MPRKRPKSERGRGRPYEGTALYERIHWVQWIEDSAEEARQNGSQKPYVHALLDLLETTEEPEVVREIVADERRFARLLKSTKKKRIKARRELEMVRKRAEQFNKLFAPRRRGIAKIEFWEPRFPKYSDDVTQRDKRK